MVYDIIILGGGASGLCCALELINSNQSVLIIEKESKNTNDRTWCYWEKGQGQWDDLLHWKWDSIHVYGEQPYEDLSLGTYSYKMLRSSDFYRYAHAQLEASSIKIINSTVLRLNETSDCVEIITTSQTFKAKKVLDSVFQPKLKEDSVNLLQHFGGYFIKSNQDTFDPQVATLMDFRISQEGETRFFYVLPWNKNEALVEMAVFSREVMNMTEYEPLLNDYIRKYLSIQEYEIKEKEYGVIPMNSHRYNANLDSNIIKIGTAGGWVKPSSGYAFTRISKRSKLVAQYLSNEKKINVESPKLYRWMDEVMLRAIDSNYCTGKVVFDRLFRKLAPSKVFQFLDEDERIRTVLPVIMASPKIPFIRSALNTNYK